MLRERLDTALRSAIKDRAARRVSTLRLVLAAIKDRDIHLRGEGVDGGVDEVGIHAILQKMVKQRHDSIEHYEAGGRLELAEQEREEIEIIHEFLPRQMDAGEVYAAVSAVIAELGAANLKDMGRVMGALKTRFQGEMDFGQASRIAKERLG